MPVNASGEWVTPLKKGSGAEVFLKPQKGDRTPTFLVGDLRKAFDTPLHQLWRARGMAIDTEQHAVELSGAANEAMKELKATLEKFKGTLANDLTAMKAAAQRIQSETSRMKQEYQECERLLTSPGFEQAIQNAERMAVALKAIGELSETKLSVGIFKGAA